MSIINPNALSKTAFGEGEYRRTLELFLEQVSKKIGPDSIAINLAAVTVATVPPAGTGGRVVYVTNGDAGSPCLAVDNGTDWLRISLGSAISET